MVRPTTKSAPMRSAWRKGYSAGKRGLGQDANPYLRKAEAETVGEMMGWSRIYAQTWETGRVDGGGPVEVVVAVVGGGVAGLTTTPPGDTIDVSPPSTPERPSL